MSGIKNNKNSIISNIKKFLADNDLDNVKNYLKNLLLHILKILMVTIF